MTRYRYTITRESYGTFDDEGDAFETESELTDHALAVDPHIGDSVIVDVTVEKIEETSDVQL